MYCTVEGHLLATQFCLYITLYFLYEGIGKSDSYRYRNKYVNNRYRIYLLYAQFLYTVQHRVSRVYIQSYFCDTKYTECKAFYPVVWIGSTHPLTHRRVLLPFPLLWVQGGRHTLLQVRGRGDPIPTKEQTLFLLLMYHTIIPIRCTEAGVLDERYSAKPAQRSSHTGLPSYIGRTRFPVLAFVDWRACKATLLSGVSWL